MRLFYVKEKLTTSLLHGSKTIKRDMFQLKNLFKRIFLLKWKLLKHLEKWKNMGENIYKMLNAWPSNCRSILSFLKKQIKDIKRDQKENAWRAVEQFLIVFLWAISDQAILWKAIHFSSLLPLKSWLYK